jgi:hypothetical protein
LAFSARVRVDETGQITGWPLGSRALQYFDCGATHRRCNPRSPRSGFAKQGAF